MIKIIEKVLKDEAGVSADVRQEIIDYLVQEIYDSKNADIQYAYGYTKHLESLANWADTLMYWNPVKKRFFFAK